MDKLDYEPGKSPVGNVITELKNIFTKPFDTDIHNRYGWPLGTLIAGLRPLHYWAMGHAIEIKDGQEVLEIGSGYPLYKIYSHKVGSNGVFIALDRDEIIQKRSLKIGYWIDKCLGRKINTEIVAVGDGTQLQFPNESFDVLIANNFTGGEKHIEEAYRVLKPGGKLITTFVESDTNPETSKERAGLAVQAGFTDVKVEQSMPASLPGPGTQWNFYVEATKPAAKN